MEPMTVRDVMTRNPYSLSRDSMVSELYDLMIEKGVRHVPIVDDGELIGLVSHRDLARDVLTATSDLPWAERRDVMRGSVVREIMTQNPVTIGPDEDLRAAGELIYENKFGCLPVVDGDALVGILTESDFVRLVNEQLSG